MNDYLQNITVLDTECTSLDFKTTEIIELGLAKFDDDKWVANSYLYGSSAPIPPEASAVNHISNRMIRGLPTFNDQSDDILKLLDIENTRYFIAHNVGYDRTVLWYNFKRAGENVVDFNKNNKKKWICTYRLAKKLFQDMGETFSYSLSYLRYYLDIDETEDFTSITAHRAGDDALICGLIFDVMVNYALEAKLITGTNILDEMWDLCWEPEQYKTWPIGKKYKGVLLEELDDGFLEWAIQSVQELDKEHFRYDEDFAYAVEKEINKRQYFNQQYAQEEA